MPAAINGTTYQCADPAGTPDVSKGGFFMRLDDVVSYGTDVMKLKSHDVNSCVA